MDQIASFSQREGGANQVFAPGISITGANATGGTITMGTSQAAPFLTGLAILAQQIAQETLGRWLTVSEFRLLLNTSSDWLIDGDNENDNVTNTGLSFPRINALHLAETILTVNEQLADPNPGNGNNAEGSYIPTTPNAVSFVHTVNLTSGQSATDINFGNQIDDDFNVTTPTDTDDAVNTIAENATNGSTVGITANATDADGFNNTITYSLTDDAGSRFTIDPTTGVVTVADGSFLDYETATSHSITVKATSSDTSESTTTFTIAVTDVDEFDVTTPIDSNAATNTIAEDATTGSTVGITANATDPDGSNNTVTYSLTDNAGGRFAIDSSTGVVTVSSALDFETATSHNITVQATSTDTSTSTQTFTIAVTDVDEFDVTTPIDSNAATNTIAEDATTGSTVGITANATDPDGSNNTVTYSLTDNAGGRFAIDSSTGVVTVSSALDFETATSHNITVQATSTDTSTSTQTFTIAVTNNPADDPAPTVTIAATDANAAEEGQNPGQFTITLSENAGANLEVSYTVSGTATAADYIESLTGTVTIAAGRNTATIDITPIDDDLEEGAETVVITLTDGVDYDLEATTQATVTIADNDPPVVLPPATLVTGTPEADDLIAGLNFAGVNQLIFTGAGNDAVDVPLGGADVGSNRIFTGSGADVLDVADNDRAFGGSGDDDLYALDAIGYRLSGGAGNDEFFLGVGGRALGGDGDDHFYVGEESRPNFQGGGNLLSGGAGADTFWILTDNPTLLETPNTIADFTIGIDKLGILNQGASFVFDDLIFDENQIKVGNNPIAVLLGVQTNTLTINDFNF